MMLKMATENGLETMCSPKQCLSTFSRSRTGKEQYILLGPVSVSGSLI
jgi:hypothetical protein